MRRFVILVFAVLFIIGAVVLKSNGVNGNLYSKIVTVVNVDRANDVIIIRDNLGYLWEFEDTATWHIGQVCKCVMNTNSTETIFDDSIVSITVES